MSLLAACLIAAPAGAQATVTRDAPLLATAGGRSVATVSAGTTVGTGATHGDFVQVTLDGYISTSVLAGPRQSFPLSVRGGSSVRLHASPALDAPTVAQLQGGMGLSEAGQAPSGWKHVLRSGWMRRDALRTSVASRSPAGAAAPPATAKAPATPAPAATPAVAAGSGAVADSGAAAATLLTPARATALADAPDGRTAATLQPGARVTPLAHDRGWVRVRVEGWVRDRDLVPGDTSMRAALSAADLRADPEGTRGKTVRWDVQVIALQHADPLRRDMAPDEPYLLARGPGSENALLYLAVPPSLLSVAQQLPSLTDVVITARVRNGKSDPVGVPILDLLSLARR